MEHFVGLDVSVRETSLCVVDHAGKIVKEARVPTEPEAIVALLGKGRFAPTRVGLEAGPEQRRHLGHLIRCRDERRRDLKPTTADRPSQDTCFAA